MNANVIEVKPFNITKIELVALRGPKGDTGYPTPEQVQTAVDAWLDDHPEATTTVQDGAITTVKLHDGAVTEDKLAESLQSLLITDTASGSIASFTDGSDGIPVRDLSVNVEPKQDLHGYSNPWPEGGNVNLLPELSTQTKNGLTFTADRGQYTVSGTPSATTDFDVTVSIPAGTYTFAAFNPATSNYAYLILITQSGTGNQSAQLTAVNRTYTFTTTETSVKFRIRFYTGQTFSNFKISPMLVSESTAPASFTPYSNICPIAGWDNVKVTRTGKNLFSGTINQYNANNILTTGTFLKAGTYKISVNWSGTLDGLYVRSQGTLSAPIYVTVYNSNTATLTLANDATVYVQGLKNSGINAENVTIQIETGSTATPYEPYQGTTITIPLGSTVYGGTLDVTTGVLTVDRRIISTSDFTTIASGTSSGGLHWIDTLASIDASELGPAISNMLERKDGTDGWGSATPAFAVRAGVGSIRVYCKEETKAEFETVYDGLQICFTILNPTTVQLTAQQMTTLLGQNNIFADAGNVDVTYVADTKLYIAKMIANALNA